MSPAIPEVVSQICFGEIDNDMTITMAAEAGQLQLNALEPIIAFNLLETIQSFTNAVVVLSEKCVSGIEVNETRCAALLDNSSVPATTLAPYLGYNKAAQIGKEALKTRRSIREAAHESSDIDAEKLNQILAPSAVMPGYIHNFR